ALATLRPAVRPDVAVQAALVAVAADVVVGGLHLPLASLREIEIGALAVDPPRHHVVGPRGFTGCGKVPAAPRMVADRCPEAPPDLFDTAKPRPIPRRGQRVEP